ncbi:GvpL/GvpF family gas vesicle protein [Dactylosporangium sp. CS-033363]|uniref:GvpL/GvpF family gas vesicle protein n=1 Tax=Dactylosporangium sp. CS-033363 TaxID=3239935 RepID=UPI003D8D6AC2
MGEWLHAVARGLDPGAVQDLAGIAGTPVRAVAGAGLAAVVSPVELDEEALRTNLENLEWLDRTARAHHAVVAALAERHAVVPAQLATVYRDDDGVRAMLRERRADLDAVLDRVDGRAEWGVKMYAQAASGEPATVDTDRPGTAYLNRRRAQDDRRKRAYDSAEAADKALAGNAAEARRLTGRPEPMLLNAAYLVDRAAAEDFAGLVTEQAARHEDLRLELTGPWPPYSFTAS